MNSTSEILAPAPAPAPTSPEPSSLLARLVPDPVLSRRIGTLALPVILGMLAQTAVNLLDTALVGRLPPSVSIPGQAALGVSLPILWSMAGFLSAISVGTQALTARRSGEKRNREAGSVLSNSLLLAVISGVLVSAIGWFLVPALFPFFNQDPEVIAIGVPYTRLRLLGVLAMVATASYKSFCDGIGKTHIHLVASVVMNIVNVVLCFALVFGNWGFPALGVQGAGIAALASTYVGLGVMILWSFGRRDHARYRYYRPSNAEGKTAWDIARLSLPSGAATVAVMTGFLLFIKIVGRLDAMNPGAGAIYTAATKLIIDIVSITFITCIAFGTATATLVGQSMGARDFGLAERYGMTAAKLGFLLWGSLGFLTVLFPRVALGIFSRDASVIEAAVPALKLIASTQGLMAVGLVFTHSLFAAGDAKFVLKAELLLHFLCLVPLAYIFGVTLDWQLLGVWLAATLYVVLLTAIMAFKFHEGKWKHIEI